MTMKLTKLLKAGFIAFLISFAVPVSASTINPASTLTDSTYDKIREDEIMARLSVIQGLDVQSLSTSEKKELRKELKKLKKEASRQYNQGVYLSVGAIVIIVVVLLIIIL